MIECINEQCPTYDFIVDHGVRVSVFQDNGHKTKAIKKWNTRASLAEPEALEDAIVHHNMGERFTVLPKHPVINDAGLDDALDLINKHGFEMIDPSLYGAVKVVMDHAREKVLIKKISLALDAALTILERGSNEILTDMVIAQIKEAIKIVDGVEK